MAGKFKSIVLDVDSTLCGVEGIDWLATRRGPDVAARTRELTDRAMNGEITLEAVYAERLELIRPTRQDVEALARVYQATAAPGAIAAISRMRDDGMRVVLVSGGIRQAIAPLASDLGVELHAVDVYWDDAGAYTGFDRHSALTTQQGKLEVVRGLSLPRPVLAVGDGATDLAMRDAADAFAAFTGFVRRDSVVRGASYTVSSFDELVEVVLPVS